MEKMTACQSLFKMLSVDSCLEMIDKKGDLDERVKKIVEMKKGRFVLKANDAKVLLVGLYELKQIVKEAIEELEDDWPTVVEEYRLEWTD